MSHYTMQNLSEESKSGTVLIFDSFGFLGETFVFIYLGMTVANFNPSYIRYTFSIGMLLIVALARLISVFLPPALYMICSCGREVNLTLKEMKVIWYSGLVRGIY
jgi:NhaP-type Na+/H+ or K+/H+ antiporter